MKTNARWIPVCLLVAAMLLPFEGRAQFTFITNNGTAVITGYTGTNGLGSIPSSTNGLLVTGIGDNAFYFNTRLTNVFIPDSVTNIVFTAFYRCAPLTNITVAADNPVYSSLNGVLLDKSQQTIIQFPDGLGGSYATPDSVTEIASQAFSFGELSTITVGSNVTLIAANAFYYSGLAQAIIDGSGIVGSDAFFGSGALTSVTISSGITNIESGAFDDCSELAAIAVNASNANYSSVGGALFDKNRKTIIQYPGGLGGDYTIPRSVTDIGESAFAYCNGLTGVVIPSSVTNIEDSAFASCDGLTSVTIPSSLTAVGAGVFSASLYLVNVTIGEGVRSLGGSLFDGCYSLASLAIPASVTNIGPGIVNDCINLAGISVADSNAVYSALGGVLFDKTQATLIAYPPGNSLPDSYLIPNTVTNIGADAFFECFALDNISIPDSVISIGTQAFAYTPLTNVVIPGSVTTIGDFAFFYNALNNIAISNGVVSIGYDAFAKNVFTNVVIPASVANISSGAFSSCIFLTNIAVDPSNPDFSSYQGILFDKTQRTLLEFPEGLTGNYTIPDGVATIAADAFEECDGLTNITFPGSIGSIADYEFEDCAHLKSAFFRGAAPPDDGTAFDDGATVYYLPGAVGWGASFGGVPTALWELPYPLILTGGPGFGVSNNQFGFTISWATNVSVVVETSANLSDPIWSPVSTNTLSNGSCYFSDAGWANDPARFYRLLSQ